MTDGPGCNCACCASEAAERTTQEQVDDLEAIKGNSERLLAELRQG